MDLYIFDRVKGQLDIVDNATSVRWRRKYFEPGEVEIHVPATKEYVQLLSKGRIVRRTDRREAAIIEAVTITDRDMAVTGRMLSSILDRAILSRQYNLRMTPERAMKAIIPEGTRVVPELTAAPDHALPGEKVDVQATYKNLLLVETRLAKSAGLGFLVEFGGAGSMIFDVFTGQDRSVVQKDRPPVIFSNEFGNLATPKYTSTDTGYKNKAYVGGQGEGQARTMVIVDQTAPGEEARELFVDAKDVQMDEGMTQEEYNGLLRQRGVDRLAECKRIENFEGEGEDVENFVYGVDWDLGDIVTVEYTDLGIVMHERVTEVEEIFERGVATFTPVFGSPLPEKLNLGDETEL